MFEAAVYGFVTSFGLIAAIGGQNAFVFKQGLIGKHVFAVCLVCALSDFLLMALGVFGAGNFFSANRVFLFVITFAGICFLIVYGLLSFRKMKTGEKIETGDQVATSAPLNSTLAKTLALTYLNPHVYLDTVIIIGGISSGLLATERAWFLSGSIGASFIWFFALGFGAKLLRPLFGKEITWKYLNGIIGVIMWYIAFILGKFLYDSFIKPEYL